MSYDKAAYIEKAKLMKEEAIAMVDNILTSYKIHPEKIAEAFAFGKNFYNYSPRNMLLIQNQHKGATYVQSFAAWKKLDANVKKGAKGIKILVPMEVKYLTNSDHSVWIRKSEATEEQMKLFQSGKLIESQQTHFGIGNVFDIGQTNYPKEKYPELYHMGYQDEALHSVLQGVIEFAKEKLGCKVEIEDLESIALRGSFTPSKNKITLNNKLEDSHALSTMLHELGHAIMHKSVRNGKSEAQIEFEADALSVMMEASCGISLTDTRKEHMISHYRNLEKQYSEHMKEKLEEVFKTVFHAYKENIEELQISIEKELHLNPTMFSPYKEPVVVKGVVPSLPQLHK